MKVRVRIPVQALIGWFCVVLWCTLVHVQRIQAQDWELVWEDEFDGTEVDTTRWSFQLGDGCPALCNWGNNEKQWYQAENATVADGFLTITAKEEQVGGKNYTSARMRTLGKGDWTYGRFEMRAKLPAGQGFWPAFWMLPSDLSIYGIWAASGEIDIMENIGSEPSKVFGTIHYGGPSPGNVFTSRDYTLPAGTFVDDFHVFAIEWEFGEMRWYVDDVLYATQTSWFSTAGPFPAPFDVDFHLLLNLAVGGNLPGDPDATTVFPQALVIDYVRVFQAPNDAPTVAITSPADGASVTPGTDLTIAVDATDTDGTVETVEFFQGEAKLGEDTSNAFAWTVPTVSEGCYVVSARATDNLGRRASDTLDVTVGGCVQAPYLMTPVALPGRVEAEHYDIGGQGTAYNDTDASNNGNAYRRSEGVDIERSQDAGFGYNVGWLESGEWLDYQVDVEQGGTYFLDVRVASESAGGSLRVLFDGVDKTGPITFEATGGWQNWVTIRTDGVMLDAGVQTMRVEMLGSQFNLNHIAVVEASTGGSAPVVIDDFEDGDASNWGFFGGSNAGGGGSVESDRPQQGSFYFSTGWSGEGAASNFYGGFFVNLNDAAQVTLPEDPWLNLYVYHESAGTTIDGYTLEVTIREDTDGNGWTNGQEDSFRLDTVFGSDDFNDTWTRVAAPLSAFIDLQTGGNGLFGGKLDEVVVVISQVSGANPSALEVDFDFIAFTSGGPVPTAVEDLGEIPSRMRLGPAFPNPFSQEARFELTVEQPQKVRIELFDLLGRSVTVLHDGLVQGQETHTFTIEGGSISSGLYVYRVTGETFVESRRVVLVK